MDEVQPDVGGGLAEGIGQARILINPLLTFGMKPLRCETDQGKADFESSSQPTKHPSRDQRPSKKMFDFDVSLVGVRTPADFV